MFLKIGEINNIVKFQNREGGNVMYFICCTFCLLSEIINTFSQKNDFFKFVIFLYITGILGYFNFFWGRRGGLIGCRRKFLWKVKNWDSETQKHKANLFPKLLWIFAGKKLVSINGRILSFCDWFFFVENGKRKTATATNIYLVFFKNFVLKIVLY